MSNNELAVCLIDEGVSIFTRYKKVEETYIIELNFKKETKNLESLKLKSVMGSIFFFSFSVSRTKKKIKCLCLSDGRVYII